MKKRKIVAIIPARMAASRFPGKPLVNILGLPMIEHVRRRAEEVDLLDEVYVATCDKEIEELVTKNGGKVIMTANTHERCTDRIEEAAKGLDADIIVNIQGDEPMVAREAIEEVLSPFLKSKDDVKTTCLVYPIKDGAELDSLNIVKCVLSQSHKILYLSRSRIPGKDVHSGVQYYKQSGVMAFSKDFLHKFSHLTPTPLEKKESVDMLRVLEHDYVIHGVVSIHETKGVDIPEQVKMLEDEIRKDSKQMMIFKRINNR